VWSPERAGEGRSARKVVPRRALADWNPAGRGHDALATILSQNEFRAPDLVPIRHGRMAASPWTYFRGAAAVMAADLASTPNTGITVQPCGYAHVLNFGWWKPQNATYRSIFGISTSRCPARSNGTSSDSSGPWWYSPATTGCLRRWRDGRSARQSGATPMRCASTQRCRRSASGTTASTLTS
jgi:Uncharacterized protein conserved in bacteria (DUF2252)